MGEADLVVTTIHGPVRGSSGDGVDVWRGIRYAAAPVGDLRWRRARPPQPHDDVVDATGFGPVCPQERNPAIALGADAQMGEDCLFLNVWAPVADEALPVMVWLHGGAYVFGSGSQPLYEATDLARDGRVVVVTLNYRLGALGFADLTSLNDLLDSTQPRFESNAALSDILLALQWVRDNIAGFGGDPDNVTVFGESAGAGIVTTLLTMAAADGLFHRAIAQSSPATSMYDHERSAGIAEKLMAALGLRSADAEQLATVDVARITEATMTVFTDVPVDNPGTIAFAPVIDGDLVPRHPMDVFRAGESMPVPLLIGTNKDEAALFKWMKSPLMPITPSDIERMFADMMAEYPDVTVPPRAQITSAYSGMRPKVAGLGVARDIAFRMPTVWLAEAHGRHTPVYLYRFDWATRMLRALRVGATHATELPYVWGNLVAGPKDITFKLGGRKTGEEISGRLQRRWTSFAHHGVPDDSGALPWPMFDEQTRSTLVVDSDDRVVDDLDGDIRRAWGDEVLSFR
ncbi:MAG: carboxylesterase [Gordonia sp.]|jgi:para-nitrobenzyl esterase|uniref:carboxylesterase/lipase family protein n=1 Tax=Gordonia sp. (in: high G+C Gram-positive bacteria) TaxID=84139 RepID=UPI000C5841EB|nr:carboxylesterase/lipase family protein [Gordonia sp. (in: high G+C Gram-positive bacteria)]MAU81819.1 carboxylesterase [Gordonia sp. (in: high G+C Gram-positive bacteria)]